MATPVTAGVVVLYLQADPTLDVDRVKEIITETATPYPASSTSPVKARGAGIINALGGIEYIIYETPPEPCADSPCTEKPDTVKQDADRPNTGRPDEGNPPQLNTNKTKTKEIKDREKKELRHKYGAYGNVLLSDEDFEKLMAEFPADYTQRIERLSEYMASSGKSYKSHLATIRSWARKEKPAVQRGYSHDIYKYEEGESL